MRNVRYVKLDDSRYVNRITGEVLSYDETIQQLNDERRQSKDLIDSEIKLIKDENNVKDKVDTHVLHWNNRSGNPTFFTKSYKVYQRKVSQIMGINELGVMAVLAMHLERESNRVVVDGKSPSNKTLSDLTTLGNTTLKNTLARLRELNLIVTKGRGLGREIYVNPYWAFDGQHIEKQTLELFGIDEDNAR